MELDVGMLQKTSFFSHFGTDEIKNILEHGVINRHSTGDVIFYQGDDGEAMYIILTGEVEILMEDRKASKTLEEVLAILSPGDVFGEGSFATGGRRSAKALCTKNSYVYVVTKDHLSELMKKIPEVAAKLLLELLKIACYRLQTTNTRLSSTWESVRLPKTKKK